MKIVDAEINQGIPSERIILGGFSMGSAMMLYVLLTSDYAFGGCFLWEAWLPLLSRFPALFNKAPNKLEMPVAVCHGEKDEFFFKNSQFI